MCVCYVHKIVSTRVNKVICKGGGRKKKDPGNVVVYRAEDVRKKCGRGTTTKTVQTRKKACVTELDYT